MIKTNLTDKNKKILKLLAVIAGTAIVLLVLYLVGKGSSTNNFSKSDLEINPRNNINTSVQNFDFKLDAKTLPSQANIYQYSSFDKIYVNNFIKNLDLHEESSQEQPDGPRIYIDSNGSSLTYYEDLTTLSFININNPKLNDFKRDSAMSILGNLSSYDFSNYYLINAEDNNLGSITLSYAIKIDGVALTKDYNTQTALTLYIQNNVLTRFDWKPINATAVSKVNLITLDYVKQNIKSINKGLYPNPDPGAASERLANYEDFKGDVEINDVELNYLSTVDSKLINPVYKFKCKFINTEKKVVEGFMIVPASKI